MLNTPPLIRSIAFAIAAMISSHGPVAAGDGKKQLSLPEYCRLVARTSKSIMELRQEGVLLSRLEEEFPQDPLVQEIIKEAYLAPWRYTEEGRAREVSSFVGVWLDRCYQRKLPTS